MVTKLPHVPLKNLLLKIGAKKYAIKHIPGTIQSIGKIPTDLRYLAEAIGSISVGITSMTKSEKHWIPESKYLLSPLIAAR